MDRRRFFQTILSAPLLTPLVLASQSRESNREIYLISDTPHTHLPPLFKELFRGQAGLSGTFVFNDYSPHKNMLKKALYQSGWQLAPHPSRANVKISFRALHKPARPSFALVKDGKIWDVRTWKLRSLWQEMAQNHAHSSFLTVASLTKQTSRRRQGEIVTIYMNGKRREAFPLKENLQRAYSTHKGRITVQIANGSACVRDSCCDQKICRYSPPVSLSGERIICAPNHFLLEIQGDSIDTMIG